MYEITFQFENGAQEIHFSAAPGSTILEAAKAANVAIDAPCNGNGSCGKCRVKLVSGDVTGMQTGHISDADYAAGWRLGCATKPAGDITVLVPDIASAYQSRMKTADLSSGEEIAIFNQLQEDVQAAGVDFTNDFVQALVELDEPTLDDTMPDTERLSRFAQAAFDGCTEVRLTYHTVKKLAKTLRDANFKVLVSGTLTDGVLTEKTAAIVDEAGRLTQPEMWRKRIVSRRTRTAESNWCSRWRKELPIICRSWPHRRTTI